MQTRSLDVWCDIFAGRAGNKDLGRFSLSRPRTSQRHVLKDKRLWSCIDIDSNSIPRTCCQLVPPLRDIPGIFLGSEYTYANSLTRSLGLESRWEFYEIPRFVTLFGYQLCRRRVESLYRPLWGGATTPTRFQERIVARESPSPRSRRYIFPWNKIDLFPNTRYSSEQLPPWASRVRDRIAKLQLAFGICEANWRDNGIDSYEERISRMQDCETCEGDRGKLTRSFFRDFFFN